MKEFIVNPNNAGQRLDKFIRKALPEVPLSVIYKALRTKNVKVNRKRGKNEQRLAEGDLVQIYIKDDFFSAPEAAPAPVLTITLKVVYEDENLLLIDKPAGLPVHETDGGKKTTLIDQVQAYLIRKGDYDPAAEHTFAPALCNRIDQNTAGIVIIAKNAPALRVMNEKIKAREISKKYLCATEGFPPRTAGRLEHFIEKDEANNRVFVHTARKNPNCLTAVTKYRVLEKKDTIALVEAELLTGRTHQIRAQFAFAGFPLVGDRKYGQHSRQTVSYPRQALYSYSLTFDFPTDAGPLNYLKGKTFQVEDVDFLTELGFSFRL